MATPTKPLATQLKELFGEDGHAWTKGVFARDGSGQECHPNDEQAASFCVAGGLRRLGQTNMGIVDGFFDLFRRAAGTRPISFNDDPDTTWDQLKAVLDKIEQEELAAR